MKIARDIEARARQLTPSNRDLTPEELTERVAFLLGVPDMARDPELKAFCVHKRDRGGLMSVEIAQYWRNERSGR